MSRSRTAVPSPKVLTMLLSHSLTRHFSAFSAVALTLLLSGCDGDDDSDTGDAAGAGRSSGGSAGSSGISGSPGSSGLSGNSGSSSGGSESQGGSGEQGGGEGPGAAGAAGGGTAEHFSFFYTSLAGMRALSKSQKGFGGDLRFGESDGLAGADKICRTLAATQGAAFGNKTWRAYLSVHEGPDGKPVNAVDRIGNGPWYDRLGRLIAKDKAGLYPPGTGINSEAIRPEGDPAAVDDFADETGVGARTLGDVHDAITGSDEAGRLSDLATGTCNDWTSTTGDGEVIAVGHAFSDGPIPGSWSYAHIELDCAPSVNTNYDPNAPVEPGIGSGGGYGGFYCFALEP